MKSLAITLAASVFLILCRDGLAQANEDIYLGRWYSSPTYDGKLYGAKIFSQLEFSRNGVLAFRVFAIMKNEHGDNEK